MEREALAQPSGDAALGLRVRRLTFSGGNSIEVPANSVLIVLGPNRAGKSRALAEISAAYPPAPNRHPEQFVISQIEFDDWNDIEALTAWLLANYPLRQGPSLRDRVVHAARSAINIDAIQRTDTASLRDAARPFLVQQLTTLDRQALSSARPTVDPITGEHEYPIHRLMADDQLMADISEQVRSAFGVGLVLHRIGPTVGFRVGDEPRHGPDDDRASEGYLRALHSLPTLESEGDGMRSFVGILLAARCGAHPLLILDEPEAFLHPPQARRIAALLARSATAHKRQIIIATHSADVIQGAMSGSTDVMVCRLVRERNTNVATALNREELAELWERPALQSVSALTGLFHEGVVVTEAAADARYYEVALRYIEREGLLTRPADLYFAAGGGKGELATLAHAYTKLGVRTAVVADIDVLKNIAQLERIVEALGGNSGDYAGAAERVATALSGMGPIKSVQDFLSESGQLLTDVREAAVLTDEHRRKLRSAVEESGNWSKAKRHGIEELRGDERTKAEELLEAFAELGLFVVPRGELESWWPSGPGGKRAWIISALRSAETDPNVLERVRPFIQSIASWFGYAGVTQR